MSVFGKRVLTDSSLLHICRFTGRGDVIVASLVANMTDSLFPDLKSGGWWLSGFTVRREFIAGLVWRWFGSLTLLV